MRMHVDYEWLRQRLERDVPEECSAGIPLQALVRIGPLPPTVRSAPQPISTLPSIGALGRLLNLLRRRDGLSLESVAEKAQVDLAELLRIEREEHYKPRPRTIVQLANLFGVSADQLSKIAGLKTTEDPMLERATLKFAAHSEHLTELTKAERDALNEYLAVLTKRKR